MHRAASFLIVLTCGLCGPAAGTPVVESSAALRAEDVLPRELLGGPHHRVEPKVLNDGYMNHYVIRSDFGDFAAASDQEAMRLVREIQAIARLEEVSRTTAFLEAAKRAARSPLESAKNVITQPVATLRKLPDGVSRLFRRTARRVENARDWLEERQKAEQEGSAGGATEPRGAAALVDQGIDQGAGYLSERLGYQRARRQWARELGVDPYSPNLRLQEAIDRVAWATTAGGLATRAADLPTSDVLGRLGEINELVWTLDPLDLRLRDEKRLAGLGASPEQIAAFFAHPAWAVSRRAWLVESLVRLAPAADRTLLLDRALAAESVEETEYLLRSAELLALLHAHRTPLARLLPGELPRAATADGRIVGVLAVDHLLWTEDLAALPAGGEAGPRELWLAATCSEAARRGLEGRGWQVVERGFAWFANR